MMSVSRRPGLAIVAIPAHDEAERIPSCLAALATQRDRFGAPIEAGTFEIVIYANNCSDCTAAVVRDMATLSPHPIHVIEELLPPDRSTAGWARKRAMDIAADRLEQGGNAGGAILTTDADSLVGPTWISETLRLISAGADGVAGYIDASAHEIVPLGPAFMRRSRREDAYLRAAAEIYALCDPRPHDPWPNHRISSGASLAVTLDAYRSIGGLPPLALGEDRALTFALENGGFKVRHSLDVVVATSCRLVGRARGGAAQTMRDRHADPDAPCDEDIEPAFRLVRRALLKGRLRRHVEGARPIDRTLAKRLRIALPSAATHGVGFERIWREVSDSSPVLAERRRLRPSELTHELARPDALP